MCPGQAAPSPAKPGKATGLFSKAEKQSMNVLKWRQQQCQCGKLGMQDAVGDNGD